jgi:hypothetical protein
MSGSFGITYKQLLPKLFLPAGPSTTKHGPNMGYNCLFTNVDVSVFRRSDGSLAFKGILDGKLYLVHFAKEEAGLDACLIAKTSMGWLWHRRLAHVGMKNLHKLLKGEHMLGLTNVTFEKDRPCAAC